MLPGVITSFESHNGALPNFGVDLTANASANTKATSYTTIAAATGFAADGFFLQINRSTGVRKFLLDIAVGAASSEVDIIQNYEAQSGDDLVGCTGLVDIPIAVAAGVRLSGRVQASTGSAVLDVAIYPYKKDKVPTLYTAATAYGHSTSTSSGTTIDPGAVVNTKAASYTTVATLTNAVRGLIIRVGNRANQNPVFSHWKIDIATGGVGAEVNLFPDLMFQCGGAGGDMLLPGQWLLPVALAAGTRLSARAASNINDATDRLIEMQIVGLEGTAVSALGPLVGSQGLVVV